MDEAAPGEELLEPLRAWLAKDVEPRVIEMDKADTYPAEFIEQLKAFGFFGATIPTEYGGLGLPATVYAKLVEEISAVWMTLAGVFNSHLMMAEVVVRYGTKAQKERYLPRFATGELRGGLALTEPDGGTDLQAIRTRAVRDGDHYRINGQKAWITNGLNGTCLALLVKTDPDAQPRHRGTSMFLVEKRPGLRVGRKFDKLGYRAIDTVELFFDDYQAAADELIGQDEGHGFTHAMGVLELGRINVASRGVGVARAALEKALAYSQARYTMGKPICEHQAIQIKLADMACRVDSARLLVERAAAAYDAGGRSDLEAGMAKLVASEAAMENAAECLRIHGAAGYSKDDHPERYYRDAPLLCIGEGTNEIQRVVIARQLVKRNPIAP